MKLKFFKLLPTKFHQSLHFLENLCFPYLNVMDVKHWLYQSMPECMLINSYQKKLCTWVAVTAADTQFSISWCFVENQRTPMYGEKHHVLSSLLEISWKSGPEEGGDICHLGQDLFHARWQRLTLVLADVETRSFFLYQNGKREGKKTCVIKHHSTLIWAKISRNFFLSCYAWQSQFSSFGPCQRTL